jgi:Trichohyalin-plectin-homology domain
MKLQEKRKDLMMEVDRLKIIKHYEVQEQAKKEEQKKGHLVIIDQIKERELLRLKEKEE